MNESFKSNFVVIPHNYILNIDSIALISPVYVVSVKCGKEDARAIAGAIGEKEYTDIINSSINRYDIICYKVFMQGVNGAYLYISKAICDKILDEITKTHEVTRF